MGLIAIQHPGLHPAHGGWGVSAIILGAALLGCGLIAATVMLLDRRQTRRRAAIVEDEYRARAIMDELCPHGWSAHMTIYGSGLPLPDDAPDVGQRLLLVEWAEYAPLPDGADDQVPRTLVRRRMWAVSIAAALRGIVADRRLDLALEEIERGAAEPRRTDV